MADTIEIKGMRFYANHGCFAEEQAIGTNFKVDLTMKTDTSRAQLSDSIADTVNYLSVYQVVKREMMQPSHLLEHVAGRINRAVLSEFPDVESVTVRVCKLNPPLGGQIEGVSVEVTLDRK
ncbi:MAG: dihydroneopterin aldolase [Bacteroidales bacterium]|nr:dihydroneopterin aldolase [Bacteroidales bacterium]